MPAADTRRRLPLVLRAMTVVAVATLASGCGDAVSGPRPDQLVEVPIGAFRVPLAPQSTLLDVDELGQRNGFLLRFQLTALVPPGREGVVTKRIESHEVRVRDEVMQTCRLASLSELSEPSLGTLQARLTKAVEKYFGPMHVRRVVISDILLEPT